MVRPQQSTSAGQARNTRLAQLRASARRPGEASFFWYDSHFGNDAVKVLPGEYFVHADDILIMTTLGSCIAVCLWDRERRIGGLNHFMLPEGSSSDGRYGSYAMELLINEMLRQGASRNALDAKVFGGAQVIAGMDTLNVGERNTRFVLDYLQTERIPIVSRDVLDVHPRKVCFMPINGRVVVKRLLPTDAAALLRQDRAAAQRAQPMARAGGSVELFVGPDAGSGR
ncbi:MAG: chemoreceptor glutamine deamidase CheD [Burkholderiaceae bacterium]|nr:chemoreceptor glutamine deamidase CheD [Burkholderiaceae bacterium]